MQRVQPYNAAIAGGPPHFPRRYTPPGLSIPKRPAQSALETAKKSSESFIKDKNALKSALGLLTVGFLLGLLPQRTLGTARTLFPVDWKAWAKIILGILSVNRLNRAFGYEPPPWLNGLQAVAVITPLTQGLDFVFSKKGVKQLAVIMPLVAGVVQSAVWLNKKLTPWLKDNWNVPPLATQLAVSTGMIIGGAAISHKLLKNLGLGAAAMTTCARGCSPGSVICLSEAGEMLGALKDRLHIGREKS